MYSPLFSIVTFLFLMQILIAPMNFAHDKVCQAGLYDWVIIESFDPATHPESNEMDKQYLLLDQQVHVEEETTFRRSVSRILNEIGVSQRSNLQATFDPSYQTLVIHHIDVIRDEKKIDKYANAHCDLIRSEEDSQRLVYDGRLTFLACLEDIRINDIIDFAYSIVGFKPESRPYYHGYLCLKPGIPVNKMTYRILASPTHPFKILGDTSSWESRTVDLHKNLTEWSWKKNSIPADDQGKSYFDIWMEVSDVPDWEWVARTSMKWYHITPEIIDQQVDQELERLLEQWHELSSEDKTISAIRFVQDQIRYLYFDTAANAYTPNEPRTIFKRRFGDCKDKAQLLSFLLKKLGIESFPCLVNTEYGEKLPERLPCFDNFNHVVLQINVNDKIYWIDPTILLQGGNLGNIHFPDYHFGLLLKEGCSGLIPLPKPTMNQPISVISTFDFTNDSQMTLTVQSVYRHAQADLLRSRIKSEGEKRLLECYENFYNQYYDGIKATTPLVISDDRSKNEICVQETYQIDNFQILSHDFFAYPYFLKSYLEIGPDSKEDEPLKIPYPIIISEEVIIKDPKTLWVEDQDLIVENDYLKWKKQTMVNGANLHVKFEYQALQEHIEKEQVTGYLETMGQLHHQSRIKPSIIENKEKQPKMLYKWLLFPLLIFFLASTGRWLKNQLSSPTIKRRNLNTRK